MKWSPEMRLIWSLVFACLVMGQYDRHALAASPDSWHATRLSGAPTGRWSHTGVWTGSELLIWGREETAGACSVNTGSRYNPTTDTWTPITTTNAPGARRHHSAVWAGSEMVVWGGEDCNGGTTFNSGGRYNPATDTWTPMSMSGAPTARAAHTAIWTGSEMIVWGGDQASAAFIPTNTGGRYNPATDTWTHLSTDNAPAARHIHDAVWTGSEMIIWGGFQNCCDVGAVLPSGGRYNPVSDSWQSMTSADPNAGFMGSAVVWTGSEMIVWGGLKQFDQVVASGARYNPSTDSWTSMNPDNAPAARYATKGVWTGSEMIVWGGFDQTNRLNSGGRYDPVLDQWFTLPLTDAPSARNAHTMIWTGSEMIVWGALMR